MKDDGKYSSFGLSTTILFAGRGLLSFDLQERLRLLESNSLLKYF
ncbi:hypothetical protein HMPREF1153_1708 [Selenomonas sp. CM52]|nr:hypothetical protein HMPREF1153_1708 [Selenomonas sp. CM52]